MYYCWKLRHSAKFGSEWNFAASAQDPRYNSVQVDQQIQTKNKIRHMFKSWN